MRKVKLGNPEIAKVCAGQSAPQDANAFGDSGYAFIRAGSLEYLCDGGDTKNLEHINAEMAKKYRLKLFPKDTVTFAKSGMSAKIGRVYKLKDSAYIVSHLAAIIPQGNLDADYLVYFLKANPPANLIPNDAYPSIRLSEIENISINLPPISDQRRIAAILDKADAICRKRKECIKMLDELVKARFVEMFGDLLENPHGYDVYGLGDITNKIGSGATPHGGWQSYTQAGISLIRSLNVYDGLFKYDGLAYINIDQAKKLDNVIVIKGDVLINITGASVARCCIVPDNILPARVNQHVAIIRCIQDKLNPVFLNWLLISSSYKSYLLKIAENGGATRQAITKQQLKILKIPLPPIMMQHDFAIFVKHIEGLKTTMQVQLQEAETLKAALMQQYFSQPSQEKICA